MLSALVARSQTNILRSQALVDAAAALIRAGQRLRRPVFAGGTDAAEPRPSIVNPRVVRTWTKVKNGALPTDGVRRRWVGPGRGASCDGCRDAITPDDTEYEIDFSNALLLRFHRECLQTWETFDRARR